MELLPGADERAFVDIDPLLRPATLTRYSRYGGTHPFFTDADEPVAAADSLSGRHAIVDCG